MIVLSQEMTRGRIAEAILHTLDRLKSQPEHSFYPGNEQWANDLDSERKDTRRVKHDAPVPFDVAQALIQELSLEEYILLRPGEELDRSKLHDRLQYTLTDEDLAAMREVAGFSWKKVPTLNTETQTELRQKLEGIISAGSEARTKAIEGNTRLLFYFAKRRTLDRRPLSEKAGDAAPGLIRGVELYDPRLGFTFSTYAQNHIEKALQVGRLEASGVPQHYERTYNEIKKTQVELAKELGRTPTDEEVASVLGIKNATTVQERIARYEASISANQNTIEMNIHGGTQQPKIADRDLESGYVRVTQKADLARLLKQANLTEKQRDALERHFIQGQTLQEIADSSGVSKETARKRIFTALEKTRKVAETWGEY